MEIDGDEHEELDVTPVEDTPAGGGKDGDDGEGADKGTSSEDRSDRASRPTGNRWNRVRSDVGETLRKGIKGDEVDHQPPEGDDDDLEDEPDPDDDDEDLEGREDRSDRERAGDGDDEDPERKGEKKEGAEGDEELETGSRYEVVDTETGDKFKIELPKGGVIRFNADGETVEMKSVDDLIAAAQKGLAFDRVTSRAGQENATLRRIIGEFEEAQDADSDLLIKLVYDELSDEEKETLQEELKAYRDPKARAGLKALADREAAGKREAAQSVVQQREATEKFWKATVKEAQTALPGFEYLDVEDLPEIQTRFYDEYKTELARLTPIYKEQAAAQGLKEDDALLAADRDARKILTEQRLRKVMRDLNGKYQKRAGKGGDGKAEAKGKREAEQHNRRVDSKLHQRRDQSHRSLRGGGAAPRDRTNGQGGRKEPVGFDAKIRRGLARLRQAGRESAGSGSEE
jgi:hypothetical protein